MITKVALLAPLVTRCFSFALSTSILTFFVFPLLFFVKLSLWIMPLLLQDSHYLSIHIAFCFPLMTAQDNHPHCCCIKTASFDEHSDKMDYRIGLCMVLDVAFIVGVVLIHSWCRQKLNSVLHPSPYIASFSDDDVDPKLGTLF